MNAQPAPGLDQASPLPGELLASTAFLLARVGTAIKMRAIVELDRSGFSIYQYSVLATLSEAARKTQGEIADVLSLDRSQLVGILDGLEERGLVERRRDPEDRRRHMVTLTPEGERQLVGLRSLVKQIEQDFLAPLDDGARAALHDALLRIVCPHQPCP